MAKIPEGVSLSLTLRPTADGFRAFVGPYCHFVGGQVARLRFLSPSISHLASRRYRSAPPLKSTCFFLPEIKSSKIEPSERCNCFFLRPNKARRGDAQAYCRSGCPVDRPPRKKAQLAAHIHPSPQMRDSRPAQSLTPSTTTGAGGPPGSY